LWADPSPPLKIPLQLTRDASQNSATESHNSAVISTLRVGEIRFADEIFALQM